MKTYIVTEQDIEKLKEWFIGDYWSEGIIEDWKERLTVQYNLDLERLSAEQVEKHLNSIIQEAMLDWLKSREKE